MKKNSLILIIAMLSLTSCATLSHNSVAAFDNGEIAGEVKADIDHIKLFTDNIRTLNKRESDILNEMSNDVDDIENLIIEIKILERIYNEQITSYETNKEYEKISVARQLLINDINDKIGIENEK